MADTQNTGYAQNYGQKSKKSNTGLNKGSISLSSLVQGGLTIKDESIVQKASQAFAMRGGNPPTGID